MPFLLLAAYADGEVRIPSAVRRHSAPLHKRARWHLPQQDWLRDRLQRVGQIYKPPANQLCILVKLRPGRQCQGLLTPWTIEEDLLWNYFGRQLHSFSWIIDGSPVHLHCNMNFAFGGQRYKWMTVRNFTAHPLPLRDADIIGHKAS